MPAAAAAVVATRPCRPSIAKPLLLSFQRLERQPALLGTDLSCQDYYYVRSAGVSGSGVFRDQASDERARAIFFNADIQDFQVIIPDFGTITGPFQIASMEYSGNHDGEAVYEIALTSAGQITFAAI